jgi:hypothetical protein
VEQISALDQIHETRRDLLRGGEKQRVKRNDEKYRLPDGEEQHHRECAKHRVAMPLHEGCACD